MYKAEDFKLFGELIVVGFSAFKDVLPLITKYKDKTNYNEIILGKWQKKIEQVIKLRADTKDADKGLEDVKKNRGNK